MRECRAYLNFKAAVVEKYLKNKCFILSRVSLKAVGVAENAEKGMASKTLSAFDIC
jgi:hypothetical protein